MNTLELKPLTPELIPAAVELDQLCLGGLWTRSGYERELASPNSDLLVLQPSAQTHPPILGLGCVWEILEEAHITILAVHPAYQRQGLGKALLYFLLVSAWRRKLEWATLEVRASNQPAIELYQQFGFESVGCRRGYYSDPAEDALILWHNGLQKSDFHQKLEAWRVAVGDRLRRSGWAWTTPEPDPHANRSTL